MKGYDLNLYSIGHSNHPADVFLKLPQDNGIECLVDVRSSPFSKFNKQFNKESLLLLLKRNGIDYRWMGESLGGRIEELKSDMGFRQDNAYDQNMVYRKGVLELMRIALKKKTAMMCSEEDPRNCHRHKIISATILNRKIEECTKLKEIHINHIRANGSIEDAGKIPISFQPSLF
jgi:uncharacterized protein (DUF488 family)